MKIKHQELGPNKDYPFANCKLEREQYALVLTDIINIYKDGFVLAINNEWGTGKTTFVKMWRQHLINSGYQTIYFNAWENDFETNPLIAIMSELKSITKSNNAAVFKSVIEKGAILTKNVLPALLKAVAKRYIDTEELIEAIENTSKGATEILEEELNEYINKKKTIAEFKDELEKFIRIGNDSKPLVFIIDELDRCRPNYAVEVLEQIKHFFSVSGIIFVLSIDKNHLASAVRGFYGSEQINTEEYLRRFIDLEYSIPRPSNQVFCKYLFDYYSFSEFLNSPERNKYAEFQEDGRLLLKMAKVIFDNSKASLRQQEKVFGQTRLVLKLFRSNHYTYPTLLIFLIYLKVIQNEIYKQIESHSLTLQELSDVFTRFVPTDTRGIYDVNLIYVQALLLHFYNNGHEYHSRLTLYETDAEGNITSEIQSKFENGSSRTNLASCFKSIYEKWEYRDTSLKYLINKINLTEPMVF